MSQSNNSPSVNGTVSFDNNIVENHVIVATLSSISSDAVSNSNDNSDLSINQIHDDCGWANFNSSEDGTISKSETTVVTTSNDNWAEFNSSALSTIEHSREESNDQNSKDDDLFGDYSEVQDSQTSQVSTLLLNSLSREQIDSLISTCFPLESSISCTDNGNFIPSELPTFTTCKDSTKQAPCFGYSLSLWNVLSNVSNDPIGIQYQWRKSKSERLFHQALAVRERFCTKTISSSLDLSPSNVQTTISHENNENKSSPQTISPSFDWKKSGLENPLTDNHSPNPSTNSSKTESHVFDINKTLDLDYYIPPTQTSATTDEQMLHSSPVIHRNSSPSLLHQSTPIKTIDLFPGSTTVLNDDVKPPVDSAPNFNLMSATALMLSSQINTEPTTLY